MDEALIEETFALAAELCEDLTPLVYARLFARHPDMEALFCMDPDQQVRGEMLSQVIRAMLDFVGNRQYGANLILSESMNHEGYGVSPAVFGTFFGVVAETLRDVLGQAWTPGIAGAWRELLEALEGCVVDPTRS